MEKRRSGKHRNGIAESGKGRVKRRHDVRRNGKARRRMAKKRKSEEGPRKGIE